MTSDCGSAPCSSSFRWDLKGRPAFAVLYPEQRNKVVHSQAWMQVTGKPLMWVLEAAIELECAGFLYGPNQLPEKFACLLVRILQIAPKPEIVWACLVQDVHKYLRVLAMVVIRLLGNDAMYSAMQAVCFEDYRNIRIRTEAGALEVMPLDCVCESLDDVVVGSAADEPPSPATTPTTEDEPKHATNYSWHGLILTKRLRLGGGK